MLNISLKPLIILLLKKQEVSNFQFFIVNYKIDLIVSLFTAYYTFLNNEIKQY